MLGVVSSISTVVAMPRMLGELLGGLVEAGQGEAGGYGIDPDARGEAAGEQLGRGGERGLAQRVGEEVRVEIGELLVEQVDHSALIEIVLCCQRRGEGDGGAAVHPHMLVEQREIGERQRVPGELRGVVDQPFDRPSKPFAGGFDQDRGGSGFGQLAADHTGSAALGRDLGGERFGFLGSVVVVDRHLMAAQGEPAGDRRTDPLRAARDEYPHQ
jgi:hypothetical protein